MSVLSLKAADSNDQEQLDAAIETFEKCFKLLDSDVAGERQAAVEAVKSILVKINKLLDKTPGDTGYFTIRDIWDGDGGGAGELERIKELLRECETEKDKKETIIEELEATVDRLSTRILEMKTKLEVDGKPLFKQIPKDFIVGAFGIAIVLTVVIEGLIRSSFRGDEWVTVFTLTWFGIVYLFWGMRFVGGFVVKVSDEVVHRVTQCAGAVVPGLKAFLFSVMLLFGAGVAVKLGEVGAFLGVALRPDASGRDILWWMIDAAREVPGLWFMGACMGLFLWVRSRAQAWNLPASVMRVLF